MKVRAAAMSDVRALTAIYANHVLHGLGTFEETPPDEPNMAARLQGVIGDGHPWLVAEDEDGAILGYAYATPFRPRSAYRFTVENSVYVAAEAHRRGAGRALLEALIDACRALGKREMLAVIGDSGNAGSIGLHLACGFEHTGHFRNVGFKHGRWLDIVFMQKTLTGGAA
jgi:phosphinothricin acetyltransferase